VENRKITLFEDTLSVELRLTDGADGADGAEGEWHVTDGPVPVAASGGWTGPDTLSVDIVFLQTPHRLSLSCSLGDGTFGARWHTRSLDRLSSLSRLRSPGEGGSPLPAAERAR
jgi:hypothetical protein